MTHLTSRFILYVNALGGVKNCILVGVLILDHPGNLHVVPNLGDSLYYQHKMNSMKLILLQSLYWSIHTKDESKCGTAFAFIFSVN